MQAGNPVCCFMREDPSFILFSVNFLLKQEFSIFKLLMSQDPFGIAGVKEGAFGTRASPRGIPSHTSERIVGCCCEIS